MLSTKNILKELVILLFVLTIAACSDSINSEPEENNNEAPATFSKIQEQIFDKSCAFAGCHAGSSPPAGLNLTKGISYTNLVNVTSFLNSNYKRVEPGNSSNSFIIKMLRNTGEGSRQMPPSGKLNEDLLQLIENWINEGAENN
jgi:hypothetical protein